MGSNDGTQAQPSVRERGEAKEKKRKTERAGEKRRKEVGRVEGEGTGGTDKGGETEEKRRRVTLEREEENREKMGEAREGVVIHERK